MLNAPSKNRRQINENVTLSYHESQRVAVKYYSECFNESYTLQRMKFSD
jgi:hypothetical protein